MQFIARITFTETLLFRHDVSVNAVNPDDATKIVEAAIWGLRAAGSRVAGHPGDRLRRNPRLREQRGDAPANDTLTRS